MPSWWTSTLRYLGLVAEPAEAPQQGASAGIATGPSYDVSASLASMAAFPWVRACIDAIGTDLSGLPLRVVRGDGADAEVVDEPTLALLLRRPTPAERRVAWERRLLVHLLLTGNAYLLKVGIGRPSSLRILHPAHVRVIPSRYGDPEGYEWSPPDGAVVAYSAASIVHIRLSNWEYGAQGLLGEGLIRALEADLSADLNAARMAAKAAKSGRPTAVFSPSEAGDVWTKEMREAIVGAYSRSADAGAQAIALSSGTKVEFPAFTPRDMEYVQARTLTRETVLAAFGVPPTRVGLPQANYATSREQAKTYWQTLRGLAAMLDEALSSVAEQWGPDLRVAHDFSAVEALQESRDARLARVSSWVMLGASPAAAAAYEGFDDAPVGEQIAEEPAALAVGEPMRRSAPLQLVDWFARGEDPTEEPDEEPDDREIQRAAEWRGWLAEIQEPAERRLAIATKAALAAQADRVAAAYGEIGLAAPDGLHRDAGDDLRAVLDRIFGPEIQAELARLAGDALRRAVRSAFARAAKQVGAALSPDRADPVAEQLLAVMVARVNGATRDMLAEIVATGLAEGATTADVQRRIQDAAGFSPMRALRIARTESTRSAAAGASHAWQIVAADSGVTIRREWLSSRDSEVRDAHRDLDGQVVELGQPFNWNGKKAMNPGDFDDAALVVNCRCTVLPKVSDE